jgi:hypothetical protein
MNRNLESDPGSKLSMTNRSDVDEVRDGVGIRLDIIKRPYIVSGFVQVFDNLLKIFPYFKDSMDLEKRELKKIEIDANEMDKIDFRNWSGLYLPGEDMDFESGNDSRGPGIRGQYIRCIKSLFFRKKIDIKTAFVLTKKIVSGYNTYSRCYETALYREAEYSSMTNEKWKDINDAYDTLVENILSNPSYNVDTDFNFIHFNTKSLAGLRPKLRVYISPKIDGDPVKVIKIWQEVLEKAGLKDKIYYKIGKSFLPRSDILVVYLLSDMDTKVLEYLFATFIKLCPSELLQEGAIPMAPSFLTGITFAPEPTFVNACLKTQKKKTSYNAWIAQLKELALMMAFSDLRKEGKIVLRIEDLREKGLEYFQQFLLLSYINPITMMEDYRAYLLPQWIENLKKLK